MNKSVEPLAQENPKRADKGPSNENIFFPAGMHKKDKIRIRADQEDTKKPRHPRKWIEGNHQIAQIADQRLRYVLFPRSPIDVHPDLISPIFHISLRQFFGRTSDKNKNTAPKETASGSRKLSLPNPIGWSQKKCILISSNLYFRSRNRSHTWGRSAEGHTCTQLLARTVPTRSVPDFPLRGLSPPGASPISQADQGQNPGGRPVPEQGLLPPAGLSGASGDPRGVDHGQATPGYVAIGRGEC